MRIARLIRTATLAAAFTLSVMAPLPAQQPAMTTDAAQDAKVPSAAQHLRQVGPVLRQAPQTVGNYRQETSAFRRDTQISITATALGLVLLIILLVVLL